MNAKNLIVALSVVAAGSAFADSTYPYVDHSGFKSTKTRAEVMAELQQAKADNNYVVGGREFVAADANFVSTKTRAQVLAELEDAQRSGTYMVGGEAYAGQIPAAGPNAGKTEVVRKASKGTAGE
jgi:hypothetical protein